MRIAAGVRRAGCAALAFASVAAAAPDASVLRLLMRHGSGWKIEQYVLSVTVPNEKMKAVKALLDAK